MLEWADRAVGAARSTSSEIAMDVATFRPDVLARFWKKVNPCGPVHPVLGTECWLWVASTRPDGYGACWNGSSVVLAHRFSYEASIGKIPANLELDHLCRNPRCVRVCHLEPVTHKENVRRGESGRSMAAKTHCPRGHEYSGDNVKIRDGSRHCRACVRMFQREYKARKREEAKRLAHG